jgi:hypothetical protein
MIRRLSMTRICSQSTTESWVKPPMPAGTNTMGRQKRTTDFCRERRNDGMWTDGVSTVILQHDNRAHASLFCTRHWIEITQNHVTARDDHHWISPRARRFS